MEKLELLAPAKDYNTALDAINCGADAIYIGANKFSARKNASNSIEDIKKIVDYAHIFNVKVYVTLNTILNDEELKEAIKIIDELYKIKVDALIIQDFGLLQLSLENKIAPIVLHMSTQADNRTLKKVKFFEQIGIKRVILARELTIDEIKKMKKNTSLELEHFVAGALCVCYSGICYMSQYIGQRSANRGVCAQACRKKYSLVDDKGKYIIKNKHLLSLKDNNLSKHLDKLIKAGVKSFKIEGRLKESNYIKNNVSYYNNMLKGYPRTSHGKIISDFTPNPYKTFNRGFCDDYLFNKKDNIYFFDTPKSKGELLGKVTSIGQNFFTVKTNLKINHQDGLFFKSGDDFTGCLVNRAEVIKEGYKIFPNKKINIKKDTEIFRNIDVEFNKVLENSKTTRKLDVSFIVEKDKISVIDENSTKVTAQIESDELAKNKEKMKENYIKSLSKTTDTPYFVKKIEFKTDEIMFLAVSKLNEIRREILDNLTNKILEKYKVKKQKPVDIAQFPLEKGDYRLNVLNEKAKEFYSNCGCNVEEYALEKTNDYKNKELMRMRHCLKRATIGCKDTRELFLEDDRNVLYPLKFDCKNCQMAVVAPQND